MKLICLIQEQHSAKLLRSKAIFCLLIAILLASVTHGNDEIYEEDEIILVHDEIWEQDIMQGLSLGDKQWAYYQMSISQMYFNGTQSLAIKVIPETFDSDPDIFISKNVTSPSSSFNSQWYCTKKGGDTCVIKKSDIKQGDILYIGVRCINPCNYTLASSYFGVVTIAQNVRTQVRLDGYSSSLYEFYVPTDATDGFAKAITFTIESEDQYNPIDLYFSLDDTIYQIEERKIENIMTNGVGFYFTENDYGWCTRCFVYFFADVINDGRYYITIKASARNPIIVLNKSYSKFVNIRQQDCFQYFVSGQDNDVVMSLSQMQGNVDLYIAGGTQPSGPSDTSIVLKSERGAQRNLILTAEDRIRKGFRTGLYEVCIFGLDDASSVTLTPTESNFNQRLDAIDQNVFTFNLEKKYFMYFRYTSDYFSSKSNITVKIQSYNLTTTQAPPKIFYRVCDNSDPTYCFLNDTEATGVSSNMVELSKGSYSGSIRTGQINHDPKVCPKSGSCYYLISVYYPDSLPTTMRTSFVVSTYLATSESVSITQTYKNILQQGRYQYYQLVPGNSEGYAYLDALTVNLRNIIGDADLYISTTNVTPSVDDNQYQSRQSDLFEGIRLKKSENFTLNRPIYISVYAQSFAIYEMNFIPEYSISFQAKLMKAKPLSEGVPTYNNFATEKEESFYSFLPWWAGYENRTIIFFAQVIFNNIFFYMQVNDFPNFYLTDWQDKNDVIAVQPYDTGYGLRNGYFLRARPDFALYDLISKRQYIFNMYAITQVQPTQFIDLHPNVEVKGYANKTSVFYRHYQIDRYSTYNFTVVPIIGNPALLLKISNDKVYPKSLDVMSWDFKSDQSGSSTDTLTISYDERVNMELDCENAGYYMSGGNTQCAIYTAVECSGQCVYNIILTINGTYNLTSHNLPLYVTNEIYVTGTVEYKEYKYYYIPVTKTQGEMVIYLNKTAPIGKNGDSMLLMAFQNDTVNKKLDNWTYPKINLYNTFSINNDSDQPEIIQLCSSVFSEKCGNTSCIMVIGVLGLTTNMTSNYRMIAYTSKNKIFEKIPIKGTLQNAGDYQYYWFSSNSSVLNASAVWQYIVAVNVDSDGQDVDLFVSALDARYPISDDYDFKSDNLGPDDIIIRSTDTFWAQSGYNKSGGVVFVIGVKAMTNNANYTLILIGPNPLSIQFQNLQTGTQYQKSLTSTNNTQYFKWFNWGFKDFRINVDVSQGQVLAYMNYAGEEIFQNNGYLAIPWNSNNSKWNMYLNITQSTIQRVYKDDYYGNTSSLFCYYCMYYFMVTTNSTNSSATYRISVNSLPDVGEEVVVLSLNQNYSITLPSTGTVTQRKYILDCKDPHSVIGVVTTGSANMYIGLYPNSATSRYSWKTDGSATGVKTMKVNVKQTDLSNHVGAYYYITLQAVNGRTIVNLSVNQKKTVILLQSGVAYKQIYWNTEERIKLYYLQVPYRTFSKVTINITSYTEDFYPTILVYKNLLNSECTDPSSQLTYPNMLWNNMSFGDNFTALANNDFFTYSFKDWGNSTYTYFTFAVYSWSYGLTDKRKAEFKIQSSVETISVASNNPSISLVENEQQKTTSTQKSNIFERTGSWIKEQFSFIEEEIQEMLIQ